MGKRLSAPWAVAAVGATALACRAFIADGIAAEPASLQKGIDALNAGKAAQAVKLLSAEIETGKGGLAERARALYFRAKAHLASGQPALAMSDANAALWMKRLSADETADAEAVKAKAIKTAGVQAVPAPAAAAAVASPQPAPPAVAPVIVNAAPQKPAVVAPPSAPVTQAAVAPAKAEKVLGQPLPRSQPVAATAAAAPPVAVAAVQPGPEPAAPLPPAQTWSSAKIKRQELPQAAPAKERPPIPPFQPPAVTAAAPPEPAAPPAVPALKPARFEAGSTANATVAVAPAPAASRITTGSIGSPAAPTAPGPAPAPSPAQAKQAAVAAAEAAPQPAPHDAAASPVASVQSAAAKAGEGVAGLLPSVADGVGSLVQSESPMKAQVDAANEIQRARTERIRAHNAALAAGKKAGE